MFVSGLGVIYKLLKTKPLPDIIHLIEYLTLSATLNRTQCVQNLCTDEPVTHPSIYSSGNCKGKVNLITKPGWQQVVVQLSTNSWRHVHRMYSVGWISPSPFCQTLRQNKKKLECWTNLFQVKSLFFITKLKRRPNSNPLMPTLNPKQ